MLKQTDSNYLHEMKKEVELLYSISFFISFKLPPCNLQEEYYLDSFLLISYIYSSKSFFIAKASSIS